MTATADPVRVHGADFGVVWDGDFDCRFFDGGGRYFEFYNSHRSHTALERKPSDQACFQPRPVPRAVWPRRAPTYRTGLGCTDQRGQLCARGDVAGLRLACMSCRACPGRRPQQMG